MTFFSWAVRAIFKQGLPAVVSTEKRDIIAKDSSPKTTRMPLSRH